MKTQQCHHQLWQAKRKIGEVFCSMIKVSKLAGQSKWCRRATVAILYPLDICASSWQRAAIGKTWYNRLLVCASSSCMITFNSSNSSSYLQCHQSESRRLFVMLGSNYHTTLLASQPLSLSELAYRWSHIYWLLMSLSGLSLLACVYLLGVLYVRGR